MNPQIKRDNHLVILLPGSRFSEVDRLLTPLYNTARTLYEKEDSYRFVVAVPRPGIKKRVEDILTKIRRSTPVPVPIRVVTGETDVWMQKASAGIAASGTVTVQSAIFGLPLVVVYKVNPITYMIGRALVKVPYITMVNLIAGTMVYEEFLQEKVNPSFLLPALERILPNGSRQADVLVGIKKVVNQLGGSGRPSANAAKEVLQVLES